MLRRSLNDRFLLEPQNCAMIRKLYTKLIRESTGFFSGVNPRLGLIMKCDGCGKTWATGNNVSHSKRHTKRKWAPNVHPARVLVAGRLTRLNLCTRCVRTRSLVLS